MPANIFSYAQASGTSAPWWSNGNHLEISKNAPIEEWMRKTGLDYRVCRKRVFIRQGEREIPIENFVAIVHSNSGKVFQMAKPSYQPFQNHEIIRMMLDYIDSGEMTLETMGSLGDGSVLWVLAKIGQSFTVGSNDKSESYLLLATSHDGSLSYIGIITSVRVVCQNTLRMAMNGEKLFKLKHTKNASLTATHRFARSQIEKFRSVTADMFEKAQLLSETRIDRDTVDTFTYQLTQPTLFERVVNESQAKLSADSALKLANGSLLDSIVSGYDLARELRNEGDHNKAGREILSALVYGPGADMDSAKGTAWGYVNAVSYYTDHIAGNDPQARLQSSWFGHYADIKDKALDLCLEYANKAA